MKTIDITNKGADNLLTKTLFFHLCAEKAFEEGRIVKVIVTPFQFDRITDLYPYCESTGVLSFAGRYEAVFDVVQGIPYDLAEDKEIEILAWPERKRLNGDMVNLKREIENPQNHNDWLCRHSWLVGLGIAFLVIVVYALILYFFSHAPVA